MAKPPRACIFCGSPANSKEHIWPVWLHELLGPQAPGVRHDRQLHTFNPKEGARTSGPTGRQGDIRTIRIRAVCRTCNNGWMSGLEEEVRPVLTPLVEGAACALDTEQLRTLAQWLTLKTLIVEHATAETSVTPQSDRTAFFERGTIPPFFNVYAAHNVGQSRLFFVRHSHTIAVSREGPIPLLDGTHRNIQAVTMVAGKAAFQVVATRLEAFQVEDKARCIGFHDRCRIWPQPPAEVQCPPRPRLDDAGIAFVAGFLERFFHAPNMTWIEWDEIEGRN